MADNILDSGRRRDFGTGAVRDVVDDKGRFDLMPPRAERELSIHFQQGAKKYADRNWEKGIPLGVFYDSLRRHLGKIMMKEHDERHDRAMAWNAMAFLETSERIKEGVLPRSLDDIGWIRDEDMKLPVSTP